MANFAVKLTNVHSQRRQLYGEVGMPGTEIKLRSSTHKGYPIQLMKHELAFSPVLNGTIGGSKTILIIQWYSIINL